MAALRNDQIESNFVMHGILQTRMKVGVFEVVFQPECYIEFIYMYVSVFSLGNCIMTPFCPEASDPPRLHNSSPVLNFTVTLKVNS